MRRLLHVASVGLLVAGVLFVLVAALSGCRAWQPPTPEEVRDQIVEIDMGAGVRCFTRIGYPATLSCVQAPLEDADCWPD